MFKFDITVHSTHSEQSIIKPNIKRNFGKNKRTSWRLNQLALPQRVTKKYTLPSTRQSKVFSPIDKNIAFRTDHLSRPIIRYLYANKRLYQHVKSDQYINTIDKTIENSWNSIYNFYRKKLQEQKIKRKLLKIEKEQEKKPTEKELEKIEAAKKDRIDFISKPKTVVLPPETPRSWKPLESFLENLETLAAPKQYHVILPRELGVVSPKALKYQITEAIEKLYTIPDRLKQRHFNVEHGTVKKSALRAKCILMSAVFFRCY